MGELFQGLNNINANAQDAAVIEENNALALAIVPPSGQYSNTSLHYESFASSLEGEDYIMMCILQAPHLLTPMLLKQKALTLLGGNLH